MIYSRPLRSFLTLTAKILFVAVLFFAGSYIFDLINNLHLSSHMVVTNVDADSPVNVWWPTDGARVADTQTFKAEVPNMSVSDYDMFWSVDGGQPVKMYDSSTDYPHKEAVVDLSSWNWKNSDSYSITFTALDHSGTEIGKNTVTIGLPSDADSPVEQAGSQLGTTLSGVQIAQADTQATSTATSSADDSSNSNTNLTESQNSSATVALTAPALSGINVWWPTSGSSMQGVQPFKAVIDGESLTDYTMYWQVDGGQLNEMNDTQNGGAHKEMSVDLSGWNWKGNGPYNVTFVAKNTDGTIFAEQQVTIYNNGIIQTNTSSNSSQNNSNVIGNNVSISTSQSSVVQTVSKVVVGSGANVSSSNSSNPLSGDSFYLDLNNDAENAANAVRSSNLEEATQLDKIGKTPTAIWLGNWNTDVKSYVQTVMSTAKSANQVPTFVVYNIPSRDCGQYSAGGIDTPDGYKQWIDQIAAGVGNGKAIFVVEPDGVALTDCLSASQKTDRYALISYAVTTLKNVGNEAVYIDAGHPDWISADDMANRLQQAGISQADGFALNTSNFYTTDSNIQYGTELSSKVGGKHFVIDTGRNGLGPTADSEWCNPAGRALGAKPTTNTGSPLVDAFLWLKGPGGSDGNCNGGPNAGTFWIPAALDMAERSAT